MSYRFDKILMDIIHDNPKIKNISFAEYPINSVIQTSGEYSENETKQLNEALEIREKYGFSFWESLMSTYINNEEAANIFLNKALKHNAFYSIYQFDCSNIKLIEDFLLNNQNNYIAFISKIIQSDNSICHVPMIDFHIPVSGSNQTVVENVLTALNQNYGYLINSGKSYHFISTMLINEDELIDLLGKMILFSPIIDRNWISHQIIERKCALRVSVGDKTEPVILKKLLDKNRHCK